MAFFEVNVNDVPETCSFELLPDGDYICSLEKSETKEAKNGNHYIELTFTVLEGQYKGRKVWDRLYNNPENQKSLGYAKRAVAQMLRAQNMESIRDTCELHNKIFLLSVGVEKNEQYGDRNNIKRYSAVPNQGFTTSANLSEQPW